MITLSMLNWQTVVEILFFSVLFYYGARWLTQDKKRRLIRPFFAYCLFIVLSYFFELTVIYTFLITYAPLAAMLFVLFHQDTLQKNFITVRRYIPAKVSTDWQQELIRIMLIARNNGTCLRVLIEQADNVDELLNTPFIINSPFQEKLIETLINSAIFAEHQLIWFKSDGTIASINASLKQSVDTEWKKTKTQELDCWYQDATLLINKTDALIIATNKQTTDFRFMHNRTELNSLSAENCFKVLKKNSLFLTKGNMSHEKKSQTDHNQKSAS